MTSIQELNERIENLRKQMAEADHLVGLNSPVTVQFSQELIKISSRKKLVITMYESVLQIHSL